MGKSRFLIVYISLLVLGIISAIGELSARQTEVDGKDFWLTFLPNWHNNFYSDNDYRKFGDSLYIVISSRVPTQGKIEYTDIFGNMYSKNFSITNPEELYIFSVSSYNFELRGYNNSGVINTGGQGETIAPQSFHITSDSNIRVIAHSQAVWTSDAFLIYPSQVLGKKHFILTYNSDGRSLSSSRTPSQFAVVAVENNTEVVINPSTPTKLNGTSQQKITLNKGEVYLVQAEINSQNQYSDLTGTEVNANKPIAVFAGQQRATIPYTTNERNPSRDILISQMPPLQSWQRNAIITPYFQPKDMTQYNHDLFRILAAYDDTKVYIDGNFLTTLDKGEFFQGDLTQAAFISASGPVVVSQYKKTGKGPDNSNTISDPFLMVLPSIQQFSNFYRTLNPQTKEFVTIDINSQPVFKTIYHDHYINVIAHDSVINSVIIDNNPIAPQLINSVSASDFNYAIVKVSPGVHTLEADGPFGALVYGYDEHNSYGYSRIIAYTAWDHTPPQILSSTECYILSGSISDTAELDTYIDRIENEPDSKNITFDTNRISKKLYEYSAELVDIYQDGFIHITVHDSAGYYQTLEKDIPGFTLQAYSDRMPGPKITYNEEMRVRSTRCFDLTIENYGKFPQTITGYEVSSNEQLISVTNDLPITISPKQKRTLEVCFFADSLGVYETDLTILNECGKRDIFKLNIVSKPDENDPVIYVISDSCNTTYYANVTDSLFTDIGLMEVNFETINCDVTETIFSGKSAAYSIKVIDPYQDAYVKIHAIDSSNREKIYERNIPGFTFAYPQFEVNGVDTAAASMDFGEYQIGEKTCFNLKIHNYGFLEKELIHGVMYMFENLWFSIPQSQFPMTIEPGDTAELTVCFRPTVSPIEFDDTLNLYYNCITKLLPVEGESHGSEYDAETRCNVPIKLVTDSIPGHLTLSSIIPNPVVGKSTIEFGVPSKQKISIDIYDIYGNVEIKAVRGTFEAGVHEIKINATDLPNGVYFFSLKSEKTVLTRRFVVNN